MAPEPGPDATELAAWADSFAHDLRGPLTVISGMAETLERAWDRVPETDRTEMLSSIRAQAAKAVTLLDDRLTVLRSPGGDEKT